MKTIDKITVALPEWSLNYLINGDEYGLIPEETAMINKWYSNLVVLYPEGSIILNPQGEHYFTWHPVFGKGCECVDCDVLIVGS